MGIMKAMHVVMSEIISLNLISTLESDHKNECQTNRDAWYFKTCRNPESNSFLLNLSGSCGYPVILKTQDFNTCFIFNLVKIIILIFINVLDIFFTEKFFYQFLAFITALSVTYFTFSLCSDFWKQAISLLVQKNNLNWKYFLDLAWEPDR